MPKIGMHPFFVFIVIVIGGVLQVHSIEHRGKNPIEDLPDFLETLQPDGVLGNLSKIIVEVGAHALGFPGARSEGFSPSEAWIPSIFKTMKYAFNYLGKSKEFGLGSPYGGDNGLSVVCLLALVVIATFLLVFLQPMFLHPKKRRMSRRFRGNPSPYSYKSPPYWESSEGKHFSSTESRPIIIPGPALVPIAMPAVQIPTTTVGEDPQSFLPQKHVRGKRVRKIKKGSAGKLQSGASEADSNGQSNTSEYDDKLTKEEIMYILKTLDD